VARKFGGSYESCHLQTDFLNLHGGAVGTPSTPRVVDGTLPGGMEVFLSTFTDSWTAQGHRMAAPVMDTSSLPLPGSLPLQTHYHILTLLIYRQVPSTLAPAILLPQRMTSLQTPWR